MPQTSNKKDISFKIKALFNNISSGPQNNMVILDKLDKFAMNLENQCLLIFLESDPD